MHRWLAVSVAAIAFLSVEVVGAQAVDAAPKGAVSEVSQPGAQGDAGAGGATGAVGAESSAAVVEKDDPMREATLDIVEAIGDTSFGAWLREHQVAWNAIAIGVLFVLGFAVALLMRRALDTLVTRALEKAHRKPIADAVRNSKVFSAVAAIPALLLVARLLGVLGDAGVLNVIVATNVANLTVAFAILRGMTAASRAMAIADELYSSRPEVNRPGALRGYRQVGMVVIAFVGGISAAALAVGKSPLVFLAALGAVAAVIGVVFKDVLFSLVANIMLTANDSIRVGDWVEMKQHSIDGRVAEIKTTSVRVQNADGTVHSVPISRFVQEPWLNYRSKYGAPGRRVRRGFRVDLRAVRALDASELERLSASASLQGVAERARKAAGDAPVTNLCAYRAFVERMLAAHPAIDASLPVMVTQQEAGTTGVPVDLLAFIKPDAGADLASIEGAILDRVTLAAPAFGLRLYQSPGDLPPSTTALGFMDPREMQAARIA
ncbi:MAG: mechanosensitive ion channel family protein [Planctomycetota bacterium]|nr:mechanosensitive ion channel family protein [Planctomycetota bacterium]